MCLRGQGEVRETCQEAGAGSKAREGVSRSVMSRLFVTPWTIALQAPLAMDFSRQKSWSGWPCPPLGDLPDPGIEPTPLMSLALAGGFYTTSNTDVKFKFHFLSVKFYCNKAIPIH